MKVSIFSVLAFVAVALSASMPQKSIIVSYDQNTPDSVLNQAKEAIKAAGGMITHEYVLFKYVHPMSPFVVSCLTIFHRGFAAKAPARVLETVQIWGNDYHAIIEEDQIVSVYGNGS